MKKRYLFQVLLNNLSSRKINIIAGSRQVSKTTLLKQLEQALEPDYFVFYFTLEDMDILNILNESPKNIFTLIGKNNPIVMMDEIQYLKNPTNFLKYLYDEHKNTTIPKFPPRRWKHGILKQFSIRLLLYKEKLYYNLVDRLFTPTRWK